MSPAIGAAQHFFHATDSALTRLYLSFFSERGGLLAFMFHALFRDQREMELNHAAPMERITVKFLGELIEYYLESGYRFISPDDLLKPLDPAGKYALLSFDDGYFNNTLALPVLSRYRVPALFCIATNNVRDNRCFWWDVMYRQHQRLGASRHQVDRDVAELKTLPTDQIEARLTARFGADAFAPCSDIDRPFNPRELREFSQSPYVHLGNHTAGHAILTNYSLEQARQQIQDAQDYLRQTTGRSPIAIAYPNGAHSPQIFQLCREAGLQVGLTVRPAKMYPPLSDSLRLLQVPRFCPRGQASIRAQCRTYRSDIQLYGLLRAGYLRLCGAQPD